MGAVPVWRGSFLDGQSMLASIDISDRGESRTRKHMANSVT